MRKALLFAFAATLVAGLAPGASALHAPSAQAKKKCKIVVKIVHGHKRKVRVCHTVKPTPSLPSRVSVTLDSAHASTASISPAAGRTVQAGGATLTVPAGAVSSTTSVTITPVTRVSGLPGKVLGAVQFEPDGLQLAKPVTLTFAVASTSGLKAFSYSGNGTSFHLYPVKVAGGKATLELTHFSGYGVGQGLPPPSVARLRAELDTLVRPKVDLARDKSGVFEQAAKLFSSWKKEVGLLPPAERAKFAKDIDLLEAFLESGLIHFADDEHSDCVEDHDLRAFTNIGRAIDLVVLEHLLGLNDPAVRYAEDQVVKCLRFELDFDSVLTTTASGGRTVSHVRVQKLKLNLANNFSNQVPLDYVDFTFSPLPCSDWATSTNVDLPFKATIVDLDLAHATGIREGAHPNPTLNVFVGTASETVDWTCPWPLPPFHQSYHLVGHFWNAISAFHGNSFSFTIDNWDSVERGYIAHKVYAHGTIASTSELTTFDLRHTPE